MTTAVDEQKGRSAGGRSGAASNLVIVAGPYRFQARLETGLAPRTCEAFEKLLPYKRELIHVRWSGEGVWIPLGQQKFDVAYENHTSYPKPGQFILYPGGISETELLLAYGEVCFSSKFGQLAGNHFMTIVDQPENVQNLGALVLRNGAQPIEISRPAE